MHLCCEKEQTLVFLRNGRNRLRFSKERNAAKRNHIARICGVELSFYRQICRNQAGERMDLPQFLKIRNKNIPKFRFNYFQVN